MKSIIVTSEVLRFQPHIDFLWINIDLKSKSIFYPLFIPIDLGINLVFFFIHMILFGHQLHKTGGDAKLTISINKQPRWLWPINWVGKWYRYSENSLSFPILLLPRTWQRIIYSLKLPVGISSNLHYKNLNMVPTLKSFAIQGLAINQNAFTVLISFWALTTVLVSPKKTICDAKYWLLGQTCGQKTPIYPQMLEGEGEG